MVFYFFFTGTAHPSAVSRLGYTLALRELMVHSQSHLRNCLKMNFYWALVVFLTIVAFLAFKQAIQKDHGDSLMAPSMLFILQTELLLSVKRNWKTLKIASSFVSYFSFYRTQIGDLEVALARVLMLSSSAIPRIT